MATTSYCVVQSSIFLSVSITAAMVQVTEWQEPSMAKYES